MILDERITERRLLIISRTIKAAFVILAIPSLSVFFDIKLSGVMRSYSLCLQMVGYVYAVGVATFDNFSTIFLVSMVLSKTKDKTLEGVTKTMRNLVIFVGLLMMCDYIALVVVVLAILGANDTEFVMVSGLSGVHASGLVVIFYMLKFLALSESRGKKVNKGDKRLISATVKMEPSRTQDRQAATTQSKLYTATVKG